jgi:hypothetical protein
MLAAKVAKPAPKAAPARTSEFAPRHPAPAAQARDRGYGAQSADSVPQALPGISWDISKVHLFPPDRTNRPQLPPRLQTKLIVGQVDDPLEHEADRIAGQVMRMPDPAPATLRVDTGMPQRQCEACEEEDDKLARKQADGADRHGGMPAPDPVGQTLASAGSALDAATRAFFEPRFGRNLGRVRVHADAQAAASARSVNALAYTVGNDVVFGTSQYAPATSAGRRLLAHELAHVVQQGFAPAKLNDPPHETAKGTSGPGTAPAGLWMQRAPLSLQRGGKDRCSGLGTSCAGPEQCAAPDRPGGSNPSTTWTLTVNIDVERGSWDDALHNQEFGHTNVLLGENNGQQYTYGFYPAASLPDEKQRVVPGCVHHPDTTHDACFDDRVKYSLTQQQYSSALSFAQKLCREGHTYGPDFTCTTFAAEVAAAAGQTLPSSRSAPTTVFYQPIPSIDNPNTLEENVQEERTKRHLGRGKYWNAPATPAAQAEIISDDNAREIVDFANSQVHRMAFDLLNSFSMPEMLRTLDRVAGMMSLKTGLLDMLPVARGVNVPRLRVALRAALLKQSGGASPEQIAAVLKLDPDLPEDQKAIVSTYLGSKLQ